MSSLQHAPNSENDPDEAELLPSAETLRDLIAQHPGELVHICFKIKIHTKSDTALVQIALA